MLKWHNSLRGHRIGLYTFDKFCIEVSQKKGPHHAVDDRLLFQNGHYPWQLAGQKKRYTCDGLRVQVQLFVGYLKDKLNEIWKDLS